MKKIAFGMFYSMHREHRSATKFRDKVESFVMDTP